MPSIGDNVQALGCGRTSAASQFWFTSQSAAACVLPLNRKATWGGLPWAGVKGKPKENHNFWESPPKTKRGTPICCYSPLTHVAIEPKSAHVAIGLSTRLRLEKSKSKKEQISKFCRKALSSFHLLKPPGKSSKGK